MIRVVLPAHLRTLARVDGEVQVEVGGPGHAALGARRARGRLPDAARDDPRPGHTSSAGLSSDSSPAEQDLSHEPPDTPLPDAVATGASRS